MKRFLLLLSILPVLSACASEPSQSDIENAFAGRTGSAPSVDKHGCDKVSSKTYSCAITINTGGMTMNQTRTLMQTDSGWRLTD